MERLSLHEEADNRLNKTTSTNDDRYARCQYLQINKPSSCDATSRDFIELFSIRSLDLRVKNSLIQNLKSEKKDFGRLYKG